MKALEGGQLQVGDAVELTGLQNQFGEPLVLGRTLRKLLFVPDRAAGEVLHEALQERGERFLERHQAVVIADISGMPGFISRFIAVPKMRSYSYAVYLGRKAGATQTLPRRRGRMTLLELDRRRITAWRYVDAGELALELRTLAHGKKPETAPEQKRTNQPPR